MLPRVLCLGNDLLADDAVGVRVARCLRDLDLPIDVVESAESGFYLLDRLLNCEELWIVDAVATGKVPAGSVSIHREEEWRFVPGASPHYVGVFEVLRTARRLGLPAPEKVTVVAVEGRDLTTVGGAMCEPVAAAVQRVAHLIGGAVAHLPPRPS